MLILLTACIGTEYVEDTGLPGSLANDEPAPAFSIEDVNPTSDSYGAFVGPDAVSGQVSAWYFGHAT